MWVKYVVPKKRETETIFGVRPIFKSHLNCYDSMISRDTSSTHYSRFGVFLFKIGMHVKTFQIEFFAIEIILSIHISSFKKVLPKCEN